MVGASTLDPRERGGIRGRSGPSALDLQFGRDPASGANQRERLPLRRREPGLQIQLIVLQGVRFPSPAVRFHKTGAGAAW